MTSGSLPVRLGWQFAPASGDPGPAPARPPALPPATLDQDWVTAQRMIGHRLIRPARLGGTTCGLVTIIVTTAWLTGLASGPLAISCIALTAVGAAKCARSIRRSERRFSQLVTSERRRVDAIAAEQARRLATGHRDHASEYRAWQRRKSIYDRQPSWFAVALPQGIDRLDVAGGTLAGWSALLTTIAATQLSTQGELTVVDLTEGAVAGELARLASDSRMQPLVWVLPADLPRFDLGTGFSRTALADVLALAAGADAHRGQSADRASSDHAADCALLERVLSVLGPDAGVARLTAALRVLADVGDPRADLRAGLITADELDRVGTLFGRSGTERIVIERAWTLESKLRSLNALGTEPVELPPGPLRIAALDQRSGVIGNRTVGAYLVAALTQLLRQGPAAQPWQHAVCLFGAERLGGDLVDRLTDACETSNTGLVIAYRSISAQVRERLGRGNAAIAFMRLGNGDDAKAASDLIGSEHRFVIGQLTDSVGTSFTDTWGDSYTSTVGTADSTADSYSVSSNRGGGSSSGRSYQGGFAPFGASRSASGEQNYSYGTQGSVSLTKGINSGTSWGISLSRALGENESLGRTAQRSRELLVEPDELQRLPPSAAIISYPAAAGRSVILADTNPALATLPSVARRGGRIRP
ncbi:MAG TPA: hypothetical protein VFI65_03300 [Streptosporangiaceae bacterium]|nr:hypothetical protein [Streptosporangiaceae bacterium]